MGNDDNDSRNPLDTLSHANKDRWFDAVKEYAEGEGKDYTLEYTLEEYSRVEVADYNNEDYFETVMVNETDANGNTVMEYGRPKRIIGHYINPLKAAAYRKDNGWLGIRIKKKLNDIDEGRIRGIFSNKDRIKELEKKYYPGNTTAAAKQIGIVATFTPDLQHSIDENWAQMQRDLQLCKRYNGRDAFDDDTAFIIFQNNLPESSFGTTVQSLNANPTLDIPGKLEILQNRWLGLTDTDKTVAHIATENAFRATDSGDEANIRGLCYNCDSAEHGARYCPVRMPGRRYMKKLRLDMEAKAAAKQDFSDDSEKERPSRRPRPQSPSRSPSRSRSKSPGRRNYKKKLAKALIAAMASTDEDSGDDADTDSSIIEVAHASVENRKPTTSAKTVGR